jgi:hypothetical protein
MNGVLRLIVHPSLFAPLFNNLIISNRVLIEQCRWSRMRRIVGRAECLHVIAEVAENVRVQLRSVLCSQVTS